MRLQVPSLCRAAAGVTLLGALGGCAAVGSLMSPYSEKFSCKNDDHGQCIHPERAYSDAVAGIASKSDANVTNDPSLLREANALLHLAGLGDARHVHGLALPRE